MENLLPKFYQLISAFGLKLIAAVAILILGKFIVRLIRRFILKMMQKRNVDPSISTFTASLTKSVLWIFVILAALAQLGVQTTSFMAVIGAAGLSVGLALQGSLSNFAAGFQIVLFRPFKVGDAVDIGNVLGKINRINIFNTEFLTFDNKKIIVPNSQIMNNTITNITAEDIRRVDLQFGVSYSSDIEKVKNTIRKIIDEHELIFKEPEPFIRLAEMAESSLNFKVRVWSKTQDYWTVFFDLTESVKKEFDKNGISIPFPQMDVHIKN